MSSLADAFQYRLLRLVFPPERHFRRKDAAVGKRIHRERDVSSLFGSRIVAELQDKIAIDFGCGTGGYAINMARLGARQVIGLDIREEVLTTAQQAAEAAGFGDRCLFTTGTEIQADLVFSISAFEHFADPADILRKMDGMLLPGGRVWIHFGQTWLHPWGGHGLSVFPWAHLIMSEAALMRWRGDYRHDGALRYDQRADGLNRMTLARFEKLVQASPFRFVEFETIPIHALRLFATGWTREFTTSVLRCVLARREPDNAACTK